VNDRVSSGLNQRERQALGESVRADGFAVLDRVIDARAVHALIDAIERAGIEGSRRRGSIYAMRNLLQVTAVRMLAESTEVRGFVSPVLEEECIPVRGLFFDKTPEVNWRVPWHQDLSIAVRARREVPGYGPWSVKEGVPHVQPPREILERMLTIRIHLDDCDASKGPLRVLPGTHNRGIVDANRVQELRSEIPEVVCEVPAGGALLMRPLLLHASSPAEKAGHRRVVHLEFAAGFLPGGVEWFEK
jgi:hypothetical protein